MNRIKPVVASLVVLGVSLAAASPAAGVAWKSRTSPLYGYQDGKAFGKTYGNFYNDGSVRAMSTTYQYDLQPGGQNVRVETDFFFREYDNLCNDGGGECWNFDVSKQTEETDEAKWVTDSRARNLHSAASGARGGINICKIRPMWNDPCSATAFPTFSY